eukprot:3024466-Amphidinium_carterae.1
MALSVTSEVCVDEQLQVTLAALPADLVSCRDEALLAVPKVSERLRGRVMEDEIEHLFGCGHLVECECALRVASTQVSFELASAAGRASMETRRQMEQTLAAFWNAQLCSMGFDEGEQIWKVTLDCIVDPPCLCPVALLNERLYKDVVELMECAQFEVTVLAPEEVPLYPASLGDVYARSCIRRRALTFPHVVGIAVCQESGVCS